MPNNTTLEYKSRINKTLDYIELNISKPLSLEELASVANFSKYHFHRIFHGMTGEAPFQFIQRVRLEKAAMMLINQSHEPITRISEKCGFGDLAVFSRNFKSFFGLSPTQYRLRKKHYSNMSQTLSKTDQGVWETVMYLCPETNKIKWRTNMKQNQSVEIKDFKNMTVAYIRHTGPYAGDEQLFQRIWGQLFAWAGPRGLIGGPDFKSLIMYHDDPAVTTPDKLRMSVCITVPDDTKVDGEIGKMVVEGGPYVVARFVLTGQEFSQAWDWVFGSWFPSSGYQPDDKPCFEMYPEEPKDGKITVDICVPVKPL